MNPCSAENPAKLMKVCFELHHFDNYCVNITNIKSTKLSIIKSQLAYLEFYT